MTKYKLRDEAEVSVPFEALGRVWLYGNDAHVGITKGQFNALFELVVDGEGNKDAEIASLKEELRGLRCNLFNTKSAKDREIARLKRSRHEWKKVWAVAEIARKSGLRELDRLRELLESTKAQLRRTQEERDYYRRDCERAVRLYYEAVNHQRVESEPTHTESPGPIERWGDVDWPWVECIAKGAGYEAKAAKVLLGIRDVLGRRIQRLAVNQEGLAGRIVALENTVHEMKKEKP